MTGPVVVTSREWLSEEAKEAAITVTAGNVSIVAFCHPCQLEVGDTPPLPLWTLNVSGVERVASNNESAFHRIDSVWAHEGVAKVVNRHQQLVSVGALTVKLDCALPRDIEDGEQITFTCTRLDLTHQ